jgi:hypothetical protein
MNCKYLHKLYPKFCSAGEITGSRLNSTHGQAAENNVINFYSLIPAIKQKFVLPADIF